MKALIIYLVAAMLFWSPAKDHLPTPEAETVTRYEGIAADVATVVLDENEQPLFPGDMTKAETGLEVVGMAFYESRFWSYVDDGSCNKRSWKAEHKWAEALCDGGQAWSFWQIHPRYLKGNGIVLDGDLWKHAPNGYTGPDLVSDRKVAARVALHMMRGSLKASGSLCGYTGEKGPCPKAKARRDIAHAYLVAHPFAPEKVAGL